MRRAALIAFLCPALAAASSSEDSFRFMALGDGPRRTAMGGAAAAVADDADMAQANPAALGEIMSGEVSLSRGEHVDGVSVNALSAAFPLKRRGAVGVQALLVDYGDVPAYDDAGLRVGASAAQSRLLAAGGGVPLGRAWSAGLRLKQAEENLAGVKGQAIGGDAGLLYIPSGGDGPSRLSFGAVLRNLGSGGAFDREKGRLPAGWALGAAWRGFSDAFIAAVEAEKTGKGETTLRLGQELWLKGGLALRAGYKSGGGLSNGLSLGVGARFSDLRVDYAFVFGADDFAGTHRMGLSWRFGGAAEGFYQEGLLLAQKGDDAEAILKFKKALDADPRHRRAAARMKESALRLREEDAP